MSTIYCNLQKGQTGVIERQTNRRYSASNIPQVALFNIDYIEGDHTFDVNDPNTMVGTYWYDPLAFMNEIRTRLG